ncbi:uncharacterized protein PHACADRAFT_259306 [Phanerochaete carnosa HHB-10118-sp]|uniref:Uncharacterized protein n=1 Tax=Phanerochaete carnosa (strain HHB-10118-sp) TaxID=650164 RepID=K5W2I4_PHACS|nr:uncharacterized protein PHACADRAFT_259306 [Phanerochaete carnosa HHB-10118-sp]EKM53129.1 hypothetical protein PHACADRAFT_259306 [Phanerochaete carnosa HHB-10118-sp]
MSTPTASPPVPNTATIILPPGLTLDQYLTLQGDAVKIAITVAVAFAIIIWDYFVLLPDELMLYTEKDSKLLRAPNTVFFIVLRYSAILATLPSLFFTSVQNQHCQAAVILSQVGACLVVFSSGAIFCFRVHAMWHGNRAVYTLITIVFLTMISCWIAVATQYDATTGPATPFGSNCQMHPIVSWAPMSFGSSVLFDSTILLLTIAKLPRTRTTRSHVGRQIFRDTLMYFALTTVTNVVVLSIQALGEAHAMLKPTAVPFSTVVTATMGSRVYLNLRLLEKRRQVEAERIPLAMPIAMPRPGAGHTKNRMSGTTHVESLLSTAQALGSMGSKKDDLAAETAQSASSLDIERPL